MLQQKPIEEEAEKGGRRTSIRSRRRETEKAAVVSTSS
jgi:hypothetical protein